MTPVAFVTTPRFDWSTPFGFPLLPDVKSSNAGASGSQSSDQNGEARGSCSSMIRRASEGRAAVDGFAEPAESRISHLRPAIAKRRRVSRSPKPGSSTQAQAPLASTASRMMTCSIERLTAIATRSPLPIPAARKLPACEPTIAASCL
jgi:hypothetical protein